MKQKIVDICKGIEKEDHVKIIFAVESGSRVWRMSSKDSDYDVRFVFIRPEEEYIQINLPSDIITRHYNKEGISCKAKGCFLDFCGFDILKYARMLSSSKPNSIEWLQSDIIYYGKKPEAFMNFAFNNYNAISVYYHYKSMCRQNYLKYLKSGNEVTYKKYLYAMRGLVNAKWVTNTNTLPPIDFEWTLNEIVTHYPEPFIPPTIIVKILEIIDLKKQQKEKDIIQNETRLDNYIELFLLDDSDCPTIKPKATITLLNQEVKKIVFGM